MSEYLDEWLHAMRGAIGDSISSAGWRDYEVHIRRHINPGVGDVPLQGLTRNQVKALYAWIQDGNSTRQPTDLQDDSKRRRPSPKTIHNIHLTLHRALQDAVNDGLLGSNPASGARKAPKRTKEMRTWSASQLVAFLDFTESDRLYALWRLLAMSGARRGEALGGYWTDLDVQTSVLSIVRQWKRGQIGLVLEPPKTDRGRRTNDLDPDTMAVLKQWRSAQLKERLAYEGDWFESDFMFTRPDGRPLDVDVVSQRFDRLVREAKLPPIRLHDLRHTHATLLLAEGVPAHVVAARLGHASEAFTLQQYAHVLPQQQADAVNKLADRLRLEKERPADTADGST